MMLDIEGKGKIQFKMYQKFWIDFLHMYGELLQIKIQYDDEENKELTKSIFDKLVTTNGSPKLLIIEGQ